jgi:hypothetical protein
MGGCESKIDELLNPARAITGDGHINRHILESKYPARNTYEIRITDDNLSDNNFKCWQRPPCHCKPSSYFISFHYHAFTEEFSTTYPSLFDRAVRFL